MAKKTAIALSLLFVLACLVVVAYFYLFAEFPLGEGELAFSFADATGLTADTDGGLIHVQGEQRADVEVNATKIVIPRLPFFVPGLLDAVTVTAEQTGGAVAVLSRAPDDWRGKTKVDTLVNTPWNLPLELTSVNANVTVIGTRGPVAIRQRGESFVVIERVTGAVDVQAEGGMIRADLDDFSGPIALAMKDGEIAVALHTVQPGPLVVLARDGRVSLTLRREVNADLTYRSNDRVFDQFDEQASGPAKNDGRWITRQLGQGGAAISIDAGDAEVTIQYFDEAG